MLQLTGTEDMIYSLSSIQGFRNCVPEFIHLLRKKKSQGWSMHTCSWKDSTDISWPKGYKHHCLLLVSLRPGQDDLWWYLIFLKESFKVDQAETHVYAAVKCSFYVGAQGRVLAFWIFEGPPSLSFCLCRNIGFIFLCMHRDRQTWSLNQYRHIFPCFRSLCLSFLSLNMKPCQQSLVQWLISERTLLPWSYLPINWV